jgi:hypothetical protein
LLISWFSAACLRRVGKWWLSARPAAAEHCGERNPT